MRPRPRPVLRSCDAARLGIRLSGSGGPWVYGATLCYRKSLWRRSPVSRNLRGRRHAFCRRARRLPGCGCIAATEMYVGLIHPGNTGPKRTDEPTWRSQPLDRVAEIAGDWSAAGTCRAAGRPSHCPAAAIGAASPPSVCVGIHVHSDPARLKETLTHLRANTAVAIDIMLLGDGPTRRPGRRWRSLASTASRRPTSRAAPPPVSIGCCAKAMREVLVFLESGSLVGPGWLDTILRRLAADPRNGLAGPSTNLAWSLQGALRGAAANSANVAGVAASPDRDTARRRTPGTALLPCRFLLRRAPRRC